MGSDGCVVNIDLDDLGVSTDEFAAAHRPHVQGRTKCDDHIGAGDEFGGDRGGEATGDPEMIGVVVK